MKVLKEIVNGVLLLSAVTGLGLACLVELYYICITLLAFILIVILNYKEAIREYYGTDKE